MNRKYKILNIVYIIIITSCIWLIFYQFNLFNYSVENFNQKNEVLMEQMSKVEEENELFKNRINNCENNITKYKNIIEKQIEKISKLEKEVLKSNENNEEEKISKVENLVNKEFLSLEKEAVAFLEEAEESIVNSKTNVLELMKLAEKYELISEELVYKYNDKIDSILISSDLNDSQNQLSFHVVQLFLK
jgi:chromosome segregation ATPase